MTFMTEKERSVVKSRINRLSQWPFGSLWVEWELCPLAVLRLVGDRQTLFYPGARCRWLDTTQWTNLGTAHARLQQTAGVAHWSTTQVELWANTGTDHVVIYPKLTAEKSWPMHSDLCFLLLEHFVLWFPYWFSGLVFEQVLSFGLLLGVCLLHRFLTRSSNKNVNLHFLNRLFYRSCWSQCRPNMKT